MKRTPLLTDPIAEFIQAGLSISVATCDRALEPDGAYACAARVHEDRAHVTLYLYAEAGTRMLRNLRSHPEIAVLFERPTDHRACQVKGTFLSSRRARVGERAEVERQVDGFAAELEAIGIPRAMIAGWKRWPCTALEIRVRELFEQTPGPGAGEPLQ
ncbi:MAG TPA: pyridoxamine 5'-phosphate oxidase family protein [Candidatus Eisenbacteria bacterium]|nr:pyridoxamine 5'-phosphate oxidase family protein [Candidatus Eisenbacteria bacterium]